jgi:site-specific DNA recombinase
MPSTNGHGPKRAILYTRVSGDKQRDYGYSLDDQRRELRVWAVKEGYEILEEIEDGAWSGGFFERPGLDRVRDLVAAGGVDVVATLFRDRLARGVYAGLLAEEFSKHGCRLISLNAQVDDSPEGELHGGMLDIIANWERKKIAERTRRGKLQKARRGEIVGGPSPAYGFRFTEDRKGYEVDEAQIGVVRRILEDVAAGKTLRSIARGLDKDGIPTPGRARLWGMSYIKQLIAHDAYRPHTYEEVKALVSSDVASRLDPNESYGIWWFGQKRHHHGQRTENGPDGRTYHKTRKRVWLEREKWIAVPVPDSGIPRELVDAARERVKDNRPAAKTGARFWELSGGIWRCGSCGRTMSGVRVGGKGRPSRFYYRCPNHAANGSEGCPNNKTHRAERVETEVWEEVSSLLKEPERLRVGIERYIEQEQRGDPEREIRAWTKRAADLDAKRSRYQDMAAEGLIDFDELRSKLSALEADRKTAAHEREAARDRAERLTSFKLKTEALIEAYSRKARLGLDLYTQQERFDAYKALGVKVIAYPDGTRELIVGLLRSNLESLSARPLTTWL